MFNLNDNKNIFMIGIGGVSMSGLAHILKKWDFNVSGSNNEDSNQVEELISSDINVFIGHDEKHISKKIDLVVYTAAIKEDNPELVKAIKLGITTMERGVFLGELTKLFKNTIGISGTHGKTTTTSLVSECFLAANMDPSIQVGATLKSINANYRVGNSDYFIIEACEYCDSFLNFHEHSAIITNIDNDHLDYFKTFDNIKKSFNTYVSHLPSDGLLVLNSDDKNVLDLALNTKSKVITYGIESNANYVAKNIEFDNEGKPFYDLYKNDKYVDKIKLSIIGEHNVLNSLGCIALCDYYGIDINFIKKGLIKYTGASRRFEYKGEFNCAKVYDDYGHHPTEVKAVADSIKNKKFNKSWVIFEPHTYSRVKEHYVSFAKALLQFDNIIIIDIYAAREKNVYSVSSNDIVNELNKLGHKSYYISDYEDIKSFLSKNVEKDDLILTLGAGYVTKIADMLVNKNAK